ncbi:Hypothetical protein (plasmid) [Pseudomonas putida]|nr:Hypothetical protein [Pseudomonas putida]
MASPLPSPGSWQTTRQLLRSPMVMSSSRDYIAGNRAVVPAKPRKSKLSRPAL